MTDHPAADLWPPWAIWHVPHDSVHVPDAVRSQFVLDDDALANELRVMTDLHTRQLFTHGIPDAQVICAPVSRLVVDVERFEQDEDEAMAARGMGAIYQLTHRLEPLRRAITPYEREQLLSDWYRPHHRALTSAVEHPLAIFNHALVIDAHSFPSKALPYEVNGTATRPEVCIGTDSLHSPDSLVQRLEDALQANGFWTARNTPFSGALVPRAHYRREPRVAAIMLELRRDLYMDEQTGERSANFGLISQRIRDCLIQVLAAWKRMDGDDGSERT